jgi:surface protein
VSNVQDCSNLFDIDRNSRAATFNEDISAWDVSKVTTMWGMFFGAASFDQDLSSWNTSSVAVLSHMFFSASSFNKDLAAWDVSNVYWMQGMFISATSFNRDMCSWGDKLPTNANVDSMFSGATSCQTQADPVLSANSPGPFCHPCD